MAKSPSFSSRPFRKKPQAYYSTQLGIALCADSLDVLRTIRSNSISLVLTSPPFGLRKKKKYGNVSAEKYVEWFRDFAKEVYRILKEDGSFVIELGGAWMPGTPTRSIYHYELLIDLVRNVKFNLAQEFFWFNPAKMPGPAQWVTIERTRCIDAVTTIWWLSKSNHPKASNLRVLNKYSESMKDMLKNGYNDGKRPSGHNVSKKWAQDLGGSIPKNLISISNTSSNDIYQKMCRSNDIKLHPARFPLQLPAFFISFLTDSREDIVLDIFGGSNVTGLAAENAGRKWISIEKEIGYIEASKYRFGLPVNIDLAKTSK